MADNINPNHYKECSFECIEMMEAIFGWKAVYNFCLCNAFKYAWRFRNKNGAEDLDKAQWYLTKAKNLGGASGSLDTVTDIVIKALKLLKEGEKSD